MSTTAATIIAASSAVCIVASRLDAVGRVAVLLAEFVRTRVTHVVAAIDQMAERMGREFEAA